MLARSTLPIVLQSHARGKLVLEIEDQAILAPAGKVMQPNAEVLQDTLPAHDVPDFVARQQAGGGQLRPAPSDSGRTCDPEHGLQVAQAPRTLLDVRLEIRRQIVMADMPLLLLEHFRVVERTQIEAIVDHDEQ